MHNERPDPVIFVEGFFIAPYRVAVSLCVFTWGVEMKKLFRYKFYQ